MTDKEFWQAVYIALIRAGYTVNVARATATPAIKHLQDYSA